MGGFGCPICSDRLDRLPAEAAQRKAVQGQSQDQGQDINISATPCGHIFHTYCINKWLTGNQGANKQCPCCRKLVANLRVLPLFPTGSDDSILDDSISGNCDHTNFNITISSLRKKLEEQQEKDKEKDVLLQIQTTNAEDFKKKYNNEKLKSEHYLFQWKQYESYKDYVKEQEKTIKDLDAEVKKFQHLQSCLNGIPTSDIDEQIEAFPATAESVKTLIEIQQVLTREVQSTSKKLDETKRDQEAVRIEKMILRGKYEKLLKDHKELQQVYASSVSFNSTPQSARRDANLSTRTPLLMASKMLPRKNLHQDISDEEIDEDVAVLRPFGIGTKRTLTKASNVTKPSTKIDTITLSSSSGGSSQEKNASARGKGLKKPMVFKDIPSTVGSESAAKKCKRDDKISEIEAKKLEIAKKPSVSTVPTSTSSLSRAEATFKKISKLTTCEAINANRTINLSSDEDDMFSPMQLRGNIPGLKVTPLNRAVNSKPSSKLSKTKPHILKKSASSSQLNPTVESLLTRKPSKFLGIRK